VGIEKRQCERGRNTKTKEDKLLFRANDNKGREEGEGRRAKTYNITMDRASRYSSSSCSLPKVL
jgi:hypothetical protein